jgi:CheY-like chemotaxis protein
VPIPPSPARVLVVDDEPPRRDRLRRALSERWDVDTAADPGEALDLAREREPDVILTTVALPGESDLPAGTTVLDLGDMDVLAAVDAHIDLARLRRQVSAANAYRAALTDLLRSLTDPAEIQAAVATVLARHLGVSRCYYAGPSEQGLVRVQRDVHVGLPSLAGVYRAADFGDDVIDGLASNRTLVSEDITGLNLDEPVRSAWDAIAIAAVIAVPLVRAGHWLGTLTVAHHEPRHWSPDDIALVEETAERTWAVLDRARAEADLRRLQSPRNN